MLIKTPLLHQSSGPRVFLSFSFSFSLSLSLSLSLYFWLISWNAKSGCVTQEMLASLLPSLSHRQLQTARFQSIKGPQHLLFNMLSRLVIPFFPRSKCLLISWLQSFSGGAPKKKTCHCFHLFPFYLP